MQLIKHSTVYPLRAVKVMRDNKLYYDRSQRKKSWVILDLAVDPNRRVPRCSEETTKSYLGG